MVQTDEPQIVNGQTITGNFLKVTKSILREVSVVAVGADQNTSMEIAAAFSLSEDVAAALRNLNFSSLNNQQTNNQGETKMPFNIISKQQPEINSRTIEAAKGA